MKKTILTVFLFASVFSSGGLLAAGTFNWAGPYVGLHQGFADRSSDWTDIINGYEGTIHHPFADNGTQGGVGGITAGYNFVLSSPYVIGLEGDFAFGESLDGSDPCYGSYTEYSATCSSETNWVGDIGIRLGMQAMDRMLLFVKGGGAFGSFDYHVTDLIGFTDPDYPTETETQIGWLVGGGIEYAVIDHATVRLEGNYMDFGEHQVDFHQNPNTCIDCYNVDFGTDIDESMWVVKLGINLKF